METKLGLTCLFGSWMLASSLLVAACGDDSKPSSRQDPAAAGAASGGADGTDVGGADSGNAAHAGDGSGNAASMGARPNVDPGGHDGPDTPDQPGAGGGGADAPDFDGVDLTDVSEMPPGGCVGGFDPKLGTLAIEVGGDASVVRLAVHDGVVQANGVDCESEAGDPAKADQVLTLQVSGGTGDDSLYLDLSEGAFAGCLSAEGAISVDLGEGKDRVTVLGTNGADVIHAGSDGSTVVIDLSNDERIDLSISGAPALTFSTGAKDDEVRCDGAALKVDAVAIPVALYGGGARDKLVGGAAADRLFGGIGNDWFDAGEAPSGADSFDGGDGTDTIDFSARTQPLTVTLGQGADDGEDGEDVDVSGSVENIYGGQAKNQITGSAGNDTIWGGPEDDVVDGGEGDDTLVGGKGNDSLTGSAGNDYIYGEEGDDELDGGADDDLLDGGEGKNTLNGGASDGDICIGTKVDKATGCEL
ncbi:MAG TPA: calcium-binding protein [Polyangiaceae bacterium]|nr:calcium-binding protein [Polyangiaceae bacterium]